VEPPGIEPAAEIIVTCGNAENNDAKRRETTCGYAKGVDGVNIPNPYRRAVDMNLPRERSA
jgi:hypothetical protein